MRDLVIRAFKDKGFSFVYAEKVEEEIEYIFEYSSKEDDKWKYIVSFYTPDNEMNVVKEHKYSVKPIYYTVFDGVLENIDDLNVVKKLVLL